MSCKRVMVGKWLPEDRNVIGRWAKAQLEKFKKEKSKQYQKMCEHFPDRDTFEEEVQEFAKNAPNIELISGEVQLLPVIKKMVLAMGTDPEVGMLMVEMFNQDGKPMTIKDFIFTLNGILRQAPVYSYVPADQIPCPIGALLTYAMNTPAGFSGFLKKKINDLFKDILNDYGTYLKYPDGDSKDVLTKDGWLQGEDFTSTYVCPDPSAPHYGFKSWDDYFTRHVTETARPVAHPHNPLVIVNAVENAPYREAQSISKYDAFWIKSQPYSIQYILDNSPYLDRFDGGTVYQGFLSPHTYHRFHAPVGGTVVVAKVVEGTYFSQPYYTDLSANYIASQPYLSHVATRGIFIIDTGNPDIGMVAFIAIGMVEVSSVEVIVPEGAIIKKGTGIGTFHFGGSSHLVCFEKGVNLEFDYHDIKPGPYCEEFMDVLSKLAVVKPKNK